MERNLDVGATIGEAFEIYRDQAGVLMPLAFWLFLAVAIVNGVTEGDFSLFWIGELLSIIVGALYTGFVVGLVRDLRDGRRDSTVGELVRATMPILWPLVGAGILYGLGVFFGCLLLLVPGLYLATIWAVVQPVIVAEGQPVFEAFGRSRQLVAGNGWRVLGTLALTGVIAIAVYLGFIFIATSIASGPITFAVFTALASTLVAPFGGVVIAILYFRLLAIKGERAAAEPVAP